MSPSVHIVTRATIKGDKRYIVRYRVGGRFTPLVHAGSFKTQKEARARRDLVAGEMAAGRDPRETLRRLVEVPRERLTFARWAELYETSRIDYSPQTSKNLTSHYRRLLPAFGELHAEDITPADVQAWVGAQMDLKPSSLRRYLSTLRLVLDFAQVKPNPARDEGLFLPANVKEEPVPPTAAHVLKILEFCPPRWRLPLVTLEQTACRVGELETLVWGDVDAAGSRFRLRSTATKTRRPRWVAVPEWLMDVIGETCPPEDRTAERRVFMGFTADVAKNAMARACVAAGIPHYHPHDFRHRRASLWLGQGVTVRELQERGGWSRASIPLDVYSHVMPLDEAPRDRLEAILVRHG